MQRGKKRTVRANELQTQSVLKHYQSVLLVSSRYGRSDLLHFKYINQSQPLFCFGFGSLVATPGASQQHKKIFFLATSTLLQVPVPVPVLKIQVPVQVSVLWMQVQVPIPEKCT